MVIGNIIEYNNSLYLIIKTGTNKVSALPLKQTTEQQEHIQIPSLKEKHFAIANTQTIEIDCDACKAIESINFGEVDRLIRAAIKDGVKSYHAFITDCKSSREINSVPVSGKVIESQDIEALVEASLDGWLTTGRFNQQFERELAQYIGVAHCLTCNSGSSANLLAFYALTSPQLKERQIKPGDEVISVAASFPTTVNPIVSYGAVPVFVDVTIPSYNINAAQIESAITPKTKAIMIAHTLGNTFDIDSILSIAKKHNLWVIEDCCDALGTTYNSDVTKKTQRVGSFGDIATFSFYPAHHITMGEGGAVVTNNNQLRKLVESFRDWGRDCWCAPGKDNSCNCRYNWQLGTLPRGYDHKYTYSHIGFNLKITDMQAAIGLSQLTNLDKYIKIRRDNFTHLTSLLKKYDQFFILPEATPKSTPSWFGYPITIKERAGFSREILLRYLDECGIGTRLLFGGNLTRQPYFEDITYRIPEEVQSKETQLPITDVIMNRTFWIGIYHGLTKEHLNFIDNKLSLFLSKKQTADVK